MKLLDVIKTSKLRELLVNYLEDNNKREIIKIEDANGYILASDILARENTPNFHKTNVDGYALYASDTSGASAIMPVVLKYDGSQMIGVANNHILNDDSCFYLNTGSMLPSGANACIMVEDCEYIVETNEVLIYKSVAINENTTNIGMDISETQLLLKKHTLIDERVMAVLASQGIREVSVYSKLEVVLVSSGNEIVSNEQLSLEQGQVRDINSVLLAKALENNGFKVKAKYLIKDDFQTYYDLLNNEDADIYITSGGSSKGNEDYTYDVFNRLCNNIICHGLAIKPGKPTIVAQNKNKLYLGLPGNPVSAYLVLLESLIKAHKIKNEQLLRSKKYQLLINIASSPGKDTLVLVEEIDDKVKPIYYRSSNVLALSKAIGYFIIDENSEGVNENEEVEVYLF